MSAARRRTTGRLWALAALALLAGAPFAGAQMGGPERKLVSQFDKDGDKRLNRTERAAARSAAGSDSGWGGGGWGRRTLPGSPGVKLAPGQAPAVPVNKAFYDAAALRTVFLQFENDDWEEELAAFNNTDVEVPATMTVDGVVFKDVGVHFRGQSSFSMVSAGSKRSLNVDLNFVHKGQRLLGYTSFNFLNAMNDPSFMRTVLYSQISRDYLPTPKINFIRTAINGEDWGIYLNAQQFDRNFLREFFPGKDDGARWHITGTRWGRAGLEYLGDDPDAYRPYFEIKTKDDPKSWARLVQLTRALNQTPPNQLEKALAPLLDVDGALKFLAIEVVLANSDGYWARASDYNLFLDSDGRFHVIPHDFNEAMRSGDTDLDPLESVDDESKPLRSKLLAVPALRARYLRYVKDIAEKWLDWRRVGPIIEAHQALIGDEIAIDRRKLYSTAFRTSATDLKEWMETRRSFLLK